MKKPSPQYRVFKASINFPFFHYYSSSKVYEIKSRADLIWPVFSYSLMTILLGFFGLKMWKSIEALEINFSGGEDHSILIIENHFDETTNLVWNNLSRETSSKLDRNAIEFLFDQQERYMETANDAFSIYNSIHLINELKRKGYQNITEADISDFFDSLQIVSGAKG